VRDGLPLPIVEGVIADAGTLGYTVVGFSGGEPLLYGGLAGALRHAHAHGLFTTVTSNGTTLTARRLDAVAPWIGLLAVSVDGVPSSHDRIRNAKGAFTRMERLLPAVKASGVPFGFIFTLTRYNLDELDWVAGFAADAGASLFQIHPLELAGRALSGLPDEDPDEREAVFAYLEYARLREEYADRMFVQLDLADREVLSEDPGAVFATTSAESGEECLPRLAELVSPLIVEPSGDVVPIRYGFPRAYALGNLHEAPLLSLAPRWQERRLSAFQDLCRGVYRDMSGPAAPMFDNWHARLAEAAESEARGGRAVRATDQPLQETNR